MILWLLKAGAINPFGGEAEASERYVVDEKGSRIAVLLDMERYQQLLEALEELESIRAYDEAKASEDEAIPFDQAVREIENGR